jgi:hypothetical protein
MSEKSDSQGAGEQRSARFRSDNGFDLHRFIWAIQTRQRSILNFLSFLLSDYAYTPRLASIHLDDPEPSTSCLESSELSITLIPPGLHQFSWTIQSLQRSVSSFLSFLLVKDLNTPTCASSMRLSRAFKALSRFSRACYFQLIPYTLPALALLGYPNLPFHFFLTNSVHEWQLSRQVTRRSSAELRKDAQHECR